MLVATALLLLPLTGCGSDDPTAAPTTTTSTTTPATTTTTTTTTTAPVPEVAADGSNLQACEDGTCEVEIKTGDVLSIRGEQFQVASAGPDGVTFGLPGGGGASLGGPGGTVGTANGTAIDILRMGVTVMIRVSTTS
jgi:hypothetical protein